jgi:Fe-S cluster assembly scaffold protein SufB
VLEGENSKGLIRTRVALEDRAQAEVTGITQGNAAGARGHVDCMEIVKDNAVAKAIPIVNVTHPLAKVTHEVAGNKICLKKRRGRCTPFLEGASSQFQKYNYSN